MHATYCVRSYVALCLSMYACVMHVGRSMQVPMYVQVGVYAHARMYSCPRMYVRMYVCMMCTLRGHRGLLLR